MRPMRVSVASSILLSIVAVATASAQVKPGARVIPLPDTLGANFDVADSLTGTSEPGDYDFLLGLWTFTFQQRNPQDGTFTPPFTGHWLFSKKDTDGNGTLIEDHWRPDNPGATWEAGTWTYRAFNPKKKHWDMEGINTSNGAWQPGTMWSDGKDRVLIEWYASMLVRFRYFAIEPDRFLWRADASMDHGKTWIRDFWTMEAHRIAR
jgi:hypothetical protein